jgi:hypothetical protein
MVAGFRRGSAESSSRSSIPHGHDSGDGLPSRGLLTEYHPASPPGGRNPIVPAHPKDEPRQPLWTPSESERHAHRRGGERHDPDQDGHRGVIDPETDQESDDERDRAEHTQLHASGPGQGLTATDLTPVRLHRDGKPAHR